MLDMREVAGSYCAELVTAHALRLFDLHVAEDLVRNARYRQSAASLPQPAPSLA